MHYKVKTFVRVLALAVVATVMVATAVNAFSLRVPQIPVNGAGLQTYLNSKGESINVLTDQINAQSWSTSASGNSVFTLMVEYAGNEAGNAIGVYNTDDAAPVLFEVFPGVASQGWHAMISFTATQLVVYLFDGANALVSFTTYNGIHPNSFGFYLAGPGGTFYSQDGRNPGTSAQILTYGGTAANYGEWWMCFEDVSIGAGSDADYDDAVIIVESVVPVKTTPMTLGGVKALYR